MILLACEDISEQKRLGEEVYFHATHDALTGLVNRREFERLLGQLVERAQSTGDEHMLCYIDLDSFKVVNDSYGHQAGDEVLRQVADRMRQTIREQDRLGRLGGDEFALLLEHCPADEAQQIGRSLIDAIAEHEFLWEGHRLHIGCCIGVVSIGAATGDIVTVLRAADAACFTAKDAGPGSLRLYAEDDIDVAQRRWEMNWANRLRSAIIEDRIEMFAQPIMTCADGTVCGFEALMRMRGPDHELIEPEQFIGPAIRYGMIREIDLIALRKTLEFLAAHKQQLRPFDWISINLSGASLAHPEGAETAVAMIRAAQVDPRRLCFEITETSVISNLSQAQHFIAEFQALGCRFALDDFGVGLASFDYLRALAVDYIKIDGSFIRDMAGDAPVSAMVEAVNEIAHLMGKTTIAEHVETDTIRNAVQAMGIDYGQGFHYARPEPLAQVLLTGDVSSRSGASSD